MLCIVFQMIGGLGSGNNNVASLAVVIADTPKSERVESIGLVEMAGGIGFLLGPVWGSVMFQIGGYPAPFACSALLYLVCWPIVTYNLFMYRRERMIRLTEMSQLSPSM